jgi:hypothetical protein
LDYESLFLMGYGFKYSILIEIGDITVNCSYKKSRNFINEIPAF